MKRRTKIATILTTGLLSAALVGVGFAAWTINSESKTADTESGNVKVEKLTDERIQLTAAAEGDLIFTASEDKSFGTSDWLTFTDEGSGKTHMETQITITFTSGTIRDLSIKLNSTDLDTAISTGYISGPKYEITGGTANTAITKIEEDGTAVTFAADDEYQVEPSQTLIIKVSFEWGKIFNNQAPETFYGAMSATDEMTSSGSSDTDGTAAEHAAKNLKGLYDTLSGKTFTFTVTAKSVKA